jgi:hypothetical protein
VPRLRGGASWDPDTQAAYERAKRRDDAEDRFRDARRTGRWAGADGLAMSVDLHPHDAIGRDPLPDWMTPRERWLSDAGNPHVCLTLRCQAEGCTFAGTYYGRADRLDAIRKQGGPWCADHHPDHQADDEAEPLPAGARLDPPGGPLDPPEDL